MRFNLPNMKRKKKHVGSQNIMHSKERTLRTDESLLCEHIIHKVVLLLF